MAPLDRPRRADASGQVLRSGADARNPDAPRPRVLLLATLAEVGGVGSYLAMLIPALVEHFDVTVAAYGPGPLRDSTLAAGAEYVPLRQVRRPISFWRDVLGLIELIRLCRKVRPQILHANSSKAGVLGRLAAFMTGTPIRIFSVHGWAFSVPEMGRSVLWADRLVRPLTSMTICVAAHDLELGVAARTCTRERTVVIRNGIDAACFDPSRTARRTIPVVISIGRLAPQKGFVTLVRALAALDSCPSRTLIVGDGPERPIVEAEIRARGLEGAITLLGERNDIEGLLEQADVFVLSSAYESLPISILEAMAAGLPVVASAVGGIPELVVDGETGFVVPPGDPQALAEALRPLLGDEALRTRLGLAGRRRVEEEFGIERFRREHLELYAAELFSRGLAGPLVASRR